MHKDCARRILLIRQKLYSKISFGEVYRRKFSFTAVNVISLSTEGGQKYSSLCGFAI